VHPGGRAERDIRSVELGSPPIPDLLAWSQRSRGAFSRRRAGSSQSNSKTTSASARIDRQRARPASSSEGFEPM
jgi:hypothetical protein